MKLINSVSETRYKTANNLLADKYRVTLNDEDWKEFEEEYYDYHNNVADVLFAYVDGYSCLDRLQRYHNYKEIEQLFENRKITLYTNENKDFHFLVQNASFNAERLARRTIESTRSNSQNT